MKRKIVTLSETVGAVIDYFASNLVYFVMFGILIMVVMKAFTSDF